MGALTLDPELLGWLREFIHERESVTIEDIQREFFPDDMGRAYLYMHRLTLDRHVYPIANGSRPNTWNAAISPILAEAPVPQHTSTEFTERVLKYVTDEFNEGAAGNRLSLPTTLDVAKACMGEGNEDQLCRWALRHLHRLMGSGKIIQVRGEEVGEWSWYYAYYALPDSGLMAEDNHAPQTPTQPLNRFGFTAEGWETMKPYQRNLIREIEMAETAPTSW